MYIIIVGAGNFGRALTKLLTAEGNDVVVIDKDKERATDISESFDCLVLNGDGENVDILEQAKIKKADAFIALTGDDEKNLMLCQFARRFKVGSIISVVNEAKNLGIFVGVADTAIDKTDVVIASIANALSTRSEAVLASIGGGRAQLLELPITDESPMIGKKLGSISLPVNCRVSYIDRNGKLKSPDNDSEVMQGDILYVFADSKKVPFILRKFLGKKR